jgi:hypothetical protein
MASAPGLVQGVHWLGRGDVSTEWCPPEALGGLQRPCEIRLVKAPSPPSFRYLGVYPSLRVAVQLSDGLIRGRWVVNREFEFPAHQRPNYVTRLSS